MTMDQVLLLNQCFEVERSKLIIKIENVDIELKPETAEINSQTNDSELLGRINVEIEAKEPEIIRYNVNVLAKEPEIIRKDKEILAIEPKIIKFSKKVLAVEEKIEKFDKESLISEPEVIKIDKDVLAKEPKIISVEKEILAVEPELIKLDKVVFVKEDEIEKFDKEAMVKEPEIIRFEKEILAVEPELIKLDKVVFVKEDEIEKFDKEAMVKEPEIIRFEKEILAVEPELIKLDKEILVVEPKIKRVNKKLLVKEPKITRIDKEIYTGVDLKYNEPNRLTYSIEPETIIIKLDEDTIQTYPEIVKLENNTIPVEYHIYKLHRDEKEGEKLVEVEDNVKEIISESEEVNPLLRDYDDDNSSLARSLTSVSSMEFMINEKGVSNLSEEDPKSILTWNVSGLAKTKSRRYVWDSFVEIIKQQNPDIVILQDVKLCSSQILGVTPRLSQRSYGGHVVPSYAQESQDANLVNELKRFVFRKYYCIHSLSPWRIGGWF